MGLNNTLVVYMPCSAFLSRLHRIGSWLVQLFLVRQSRFLLQSCESFPISCRYPHLSNSHYQQNFFTIENKHLEMNTRTKHTLQAAIEYGIFVKVLPKVRSWFFCMNEPYLHTMPNKSGKDSKKWFLLLAHINI